MIFSLLARRTPVTAALAAPPHALWAESAATLGTILGRSDTAILKKGQGNEDAGELDLVVVTLPGYSLVAAAGARSSRDSVGKAAGYSASAIQDPGPDN